MQIRLLGYPELRLADGEALHLRARCVSLIGFLAYNRDRSFSRASVATALWPDELEETTRANLRRVLHLISAALPPGESPLFNDAQGRLKWNADGKHWVDLIEFDRLASSFETATEAAAVYHGDFLIGIDHEWVYGAREAIHSRYVELLLLIGERSLALGDYARAIDAADRLLGIDEWREDAVRLKMRSMYAAGDRSGALLVLERFDRALKVEMGVEPMVDTVALGAAISANLGPSIIAPDIHEAQPVDATATIPFIGRETELQTLRSAWHRAARSNGKVIFIQGEAGIGKTRLTRELISLVASEGGCVLAGSTSHPQTEPYQPIVAALRRGIPFLSQAEIDDVWLATLSDVLPDVLGVRQNLKPLEAIEVANAASRLFEAFVRVLSAIARLKPVLLVLEDLQWADDSTIALLDGIARRAAALPLLIVATFRTGDEEPESFARTRNALLTSHRGSVVSLGALQRGAFLSLCELAEYENVPTTVIEQAATLGAGNPLFFTLLFQAYREAGTLSFAISSVSSITDAISLRLRTLDERGQTLAQVAAVIGASFDASLLARIVGWSDSEIYGALDQLVDAGIMREVNASFEYGFSHALLERTLYESLEPSARMQRHRRIAAALSNANEPRHAAVVARHWEEAGEREQARKAYTRAMHFDLAAFAWSTALGHSRSALALCENDEDRFDILLAIAEVGRAIGDVAAWKADVAALEACAARVGTPQARLQALLRMNALSQHSGNRERQKSSAEEIVSVATDARLDSYRVEGLIALASYYFDKAQLVECARTVEELLANADHALEPQKQATLLALYGLTLVRLGRMDEAASFSVKARTIVGEDGIRARRSVFLDYAIADARRDLKTMGACARELVELDRRRGDLANEQASLTLLASALEHSPDDAREAYTRAFEIAETGAVSLSAFVINSVNRSNYEYGLGRFDLAFDYARRAREKALEAGGIAFLGYATINEAQALRELGDAQEARALASEVRDAVLELREPDLLAASMASLGETQLALGDVRSAMATLEEAVEKRRLAQRPSVLVGDLSILAQAYLAADELQKAQLVTDEMVTIVGDRVEDFHEPTKLCSTIATVSAASDDRDSETVWIERGRTIAKRTLEHISDEPTRNAYLNLPHTRHVMG